MILNIFDQFLFFWWTVGIFVSLVFYALTAKAFNLKWWQGAVVGLINLVVLAIGAKIMYVIEQFDVVMQTGFTFNGFSLYGAIFFLPLAIFINSLIFKKSNFKLGSFSIIPLVIMLGFYRIDCAIHGCCGGIIINNAAVPTQIIEIVFCSLLVIIFSLMTFWKHKTNGETYIMFYFVYGFFRFILEFLRERDNIFWEMSISHIWSILSIIVGAILLNYYIKINWKDENEAK